MAGVMEKQSGTTWVGDLVVGAGWMFLGALDALRLWHGRGHLTLFQELLGGTVVLIAPVLAARRVSRLVEAWKARHA